MHYSAAKQVLIALWSHAQEPETMIPFLKSSPGIGKTALLYDVAAALGITDVRVVIASQRDSTELAGIPNIDPTRGEVNFASMPFFSGLFADTDPDGAPAIIFFDELPDGDTGVRNAISNILSSLAVEGRRLRRNVFICAAGNRKEDRSGAQRMLTKTSDRIIDVNVEPDLHSWITNIAIPESLPVDLIQYLECFDLDSEGRSAFNDFDPNRDKNSTPRGWHRVGRIVRDVFPHVPEPLHREILCGIVGESRGTEYHTFRGLRQHVPTFADIAQHPDSAKLPDRPDATYYVIGYAAAGTINEPDAFPAVVRYLSRLRTDMREVARRTVERVVPRSTWGQVYAAEWQAFAFGGDRRTGR